MFDSIKFSSESIYMVPIFFFSIGLFLPQLLLLGIIEISSIIALLGFFIILFVQSVESEDDWKKSKNILKILKLFFIIPIVLWVALLLWGLINNIIIHGPNPILLYWLSTLYFTHIIFLIGVVWYVGYYVSQSEGINAVGLALIIWGLIFLLKKIVFGGVELSYLIQDYTIPIYYGINFLSIILFFQCISLNNRRKRVNFSLPESEEKTNQIYIDNIFGCIILVLLALLLLYIIISTPKILPVYIDPTLNDTIEYEYGFKYWIFGIVGILALIIKPIISEMRNFITRRGVS